MGVPPEKTAAGERSRESILDATERLMATKGLRGDLDQRHPRRVRASTRFIYWHFGPKEGVLAMERGAQRLPRYPMRPASLPIKRSEPADRAGEPASRSIRLPVPVLPAVDETEARIRRCHGGAPVRNTAIARFSRDSTTHLLPSDYPAGQPISNSRGS